MVYAFLGNFLLSIIPIAIIMGISSAFAFYKINNKPFINVVEAAFKYYIGNKLYIWRKEENVKKPNSNEAISQAKNYASVMVPKISDSKLKDLTWSLDIKESMYTNPNQK